MVHLVLGPWNHGRDAAKAAASVQIQFEGDTATWFRRTVMQPFLDHYLKDGAEARHAARAGRTKPAPINGIATTPGRARAQRAARRAARNLYLLPGGRLGFERPPAIQPQRAIDEYVSDPAKPVPYRLAPDAGAGAPDSTWGEWLVDDQRNAASRPDVLVYETEPLKEPLRVAGKPIAGPVCLDQRKRFGLGGQDSSMSGPMRCPTTPKLGGYQQMLSADILRGRYRRRLCDTRTPIDARQGAALPHPAAQREPHFLPGHRIMVQVQSSWFPLYDRNPQQVCTEHHVGAARGLRRRQPSVSGTTAGAASADRAAGDRSEGPSTAPLSH